MPSKQVILHCKSLLLWHIYSLSRLCHAIQGRSSTAFVSSYSLHAWHVGDNEILFSALVSECTVSRANSFFFKKCGGDFFSVARLLPETNCATRSAKNSRFSTFIIGVDLFHLTLIFFKPRSYSSSSPPLMPAKMQYAAEKQANTTIWKRAVAEDAPLAFYPAVPCTFLPFEFNGQKLVVVEVKVRQWIWGER